jgi:hypothetical protein
MWEHLQTAPGVLVIWAVTHPSTDRAQQSLTSVIKWVPVCPTWQDASSLVAALIVKLLHIHTAVRLLDQGTQFFY